MSLSASKYHNTLTYLRNQLANLMCILPFPKQSDTNVLELQPYRTEKDDFDQSSKKTTVSMHSSSDDHNKSFQHMVNISALTNAFAHLGWHKQFSFESQKPLV